MRDPVKICLGETEMAAVIDVFRVYEVGFRSGLLKAEVSSEYILKPILCSAGKT